MFERGWREFYQGSFAKAAVTRPKGNSMSLAKLGFKFLVCPSRIKGEWHHASGVAALVQAGWTDCTEMSDEQFDEFMGVLV